MAKVGHNDPATTMSIYTHVTEGMSREAVRDMNDKKSPQASNESSLRGLFLFWIW